MKKQTYYSVRTVQASSLKEATQKVIDENFDEANKLCDVILTQEELMQSLTQGQALSEKNKQEAIIALIIAVDQLQLETSYDLDSDPIHKEARKKRYAVIASLQKSINKLK